MKKYRRIAKFSLPIDFVESGQAGKVFAYIEFTALRLECVNYANIYEFTGLSPILKR